MLEGSGRDGADEEEAEDEAADGAWEGFTWQGFARGGGLALGVAARGEEPAASSGGRPEHRQVVSADDEWLLDDTWPSDDECSSVEEAALADDEWSSEEESDEQSLGHEEPEDAVCTEAASGDDVRHEYVRRGLRDDARAEDSGLREAAATGKRGVEASGGRVGGRAA